MQANPALATYGTLPRNFFRGPGYINFDMTFSKTTAITERVKFEFRAEFFNIFNHANFTNPGIINNGTANGNTNPFTSGAGGNNPNSPQFGQNHLNFQSEDYPASSALFLLMRAVETMLRSAVEPFGGNPA